jgi:uncharacterized repeat protein (TIGR03943 family)
MAPAVSVRDAYRTVLCVGLLALWMGATNAMFKYLKPSMRPWLLAAAVALIGLGVYGLVRGNRAEGDPHDGHDHRLGVGWLLTVPVIVIVLFGTEALGAYAAQQASGTLPPYSFNLAAYAESQGGATPVLMTQDVVNGVHTRANREFLLTHDVRLTGFVTAPGKFGPGSFVLSHFLITCCAADAYALLIGMTRVREVPASGQWVEVVARLRPHLRAVTDDDIPAVMQLRSLKPIDEPKAPYEAIR